MISAKKVLIKIEEAVRLVEANLNQLKQEAEKLAGIKHHNLGPWKDSGYPDSFMAECTKCGAWCEITASSNPKNIDVEGPAVIIDCGRKWRPLPSAKRKRF